MAPAKGRSPGSKINSKGRTKRYEKHVRLYRHLLESAAYKSLSCYGRAALIELMYRHDGTNNGRVPLSVRETASKLGIADKTAQKALQEVCEKGFTHVTRIGSFDRKIRHATEWALAMEPIGDKSATKEFMRWQPPEKQNTVVRRPTDGGNSYYRGRHQDAENRPDGGT